MTNSENGFSGFVRFVWATASPTQNDTSNQNRIIGEMHGCIVCAKIFSVLAVYAPDGRLVDCTVTSPGGHRVLNQRQPLVACDIHPVEKIEAAYNRWQSKNGKEQGDE